MLKHPRTAYSQIWKEYYQDGLWRDVQSGDGIKQISYEKDFSTTARPDPSNDPQGSRATVTADPGGDYVDALDIRKALAQQKFDEARSRYGTRYTEYLQYLGVKPSDARLQRPEYFGGGVGNINFSEVLSTVESAQEPQGRLTGHGVAGVRTRTLSKYCEEHGLIMMMLSVRPKLAYDRHMRRYYRKTNWDNWWQKETELQEQQAVQNGEIFADGTAADSLPFGYNDPNYDLTSQPSVISAEMRDLYNFWHMVPQYTNRPGLNSVYSFVNNEASKRCFADQTSNSLLFAINHRAVARRLVAPRNAAPRTV